MKIPQSEKDKRVSLGLLLYDAFFYVFLMMDAEFKVNGEIDRDYYVRSLDNRIGDILTEYPLDEGYTLRLAEDIIDATERHLDDPYYFSQERALIAAQNEANTVINNQDFTIAKSEGKKYKQWITEDDLRVRQWHEEVDGIRVPIDEYFHVGNDDMRFPHDYMNGSPENLVNCRCACIYE